MNCLITSTHEGCVVRISDIIAYVGKDRLDAGIAQKTLRDVFADDEMGETNAEIINNLMVNVIENSYGEDYIKLDDRHFEALKKIKKSNYEHIYESKSDNAQLAAAVKPMMSEIYEKLLSDLKNGNTKSPVFTHHINYINKNARDRMEPYENTDENQIIVDYIASMTDDYFIDLYQYLFPEGRYKIVYKGYFD